MITYQSLFIFSGIIANQIKKEEVAEKYVGSLFDQLEDFSFGSIVVYNII